MNDTAFKSKVSKDFDKTKKDLITLGDDGIVGLSRLFDRLAGEIKKTLNGTVKNFNKGFDKGLSRYNEKIQDAADLIPGAFSRRAAGYPWVTVTISLVLGLLLGVILKPGRQPTV